MTLVLIGNGLLLEGSTPKAKDETTARYIIIPSDPKYLEPVFYWVLIEVSLTCLHFFVQASC